MRCVVDEILLTRRLMRDGEPRRKAFDIDAGVDAETDRGIGIGVDRRTGMDIDIEITRRIRVDGANKGQSSVEYAVVLAAFLALVVGLGVMGRFMDEGVIVEHALQSASHHLQEVATGAWGDVFLY